MTSALPTRPKKTRTAQFIDVPSHILDAIVDELCPMDRVKLSTCHSSLTFLDSLESVTLTLPMKKEMADSFCRWVFQKRPGMLKNLTITDDPEWFIRVHDDDYAHETLLAVLIAVGYGIRRVVMDSRSFPHEALLPTMVGVERAVILGAPFIPMFPLRHCSKLRTLILNAGLDIDNSIGDEIEDTAADLDGIVEAPALHTLCIQNHAGYVCLCQLPDLRHTLERLEIVGTETHPIAVTNTDQCRYMSIMRELVLDSVTAFTSSDVLLSMPLLEVLDLSARHPATDWRQVVHTFDGYVDYTSDFYEAVKNLAHLRVLGCRDVCLTNDFRAPTVRTIHVSFYSLVRSVLAGLSLHHMPALDTVVIDGAFACDDDDDMDQRISQRLIDFFMPETRVTLILKTSPHDNVPVMSAFWLRTAQSLPRITFQVVDSCM